MTFYKEGRRLNYKEIVKMHEALIKHDILTALEVEEVTRLFIRMLNFTEQKLGSCLSKCGYYTGDDKEIFEGATTLKITSDLEIWQKALGYKEKMLTREISEEEKIEVIDFMADELLVAMSNVSEHPEMSRN